jgi:hypothetical protein
MIVLTHLGVDGNQITIQAKAERMALLSWGTGSFWVEFRGAYPESGLRLDVPCNVSKAMLRKVNLALKLGKYYGKP